MNHLIGSVLLSVIAISGCRQPDRDISAANVTADPKTNVTTPSAINRDQAANQEKVLKPRLWQDEEMAEMAARLLNLKRRDAAIAIRWEHAELSGFVELADDEDDDPTRRDLLNSLDSQIRAWSLDSDAVTDKDFSGWLLVVIRVLSEDADWRTNEVEILGQGLASYKEAENPKVTHGDSLLFSAKGIQRKWIRPDNSAKSGIYVNSNAGTHSTSLSDNEFALSIKTKDDESEEVTKVAWLELKIEPIE